MYMGAIESVVSLIVWASVQIIKRELEGNIAFQETTTASVKTPKATASPSSFFKSDNTQEAVRSWWHVRLYIFAPSRT